MNVLKSLPGLVLVLAVACSSSDSNNTQAGPSDCVKRCKAVAVECSLDDSQCSTTCEQVTEKELACMEKASCDSATYEACVSTSTATDNGSATPDATVEDSGTASKKLPCYGSNDGCDAATQFCLVSVQGTINMAGMCAPIPSGCFDCDCMSDAAEDEWKKANNDTDNCSNAMYACDGGSDGFTIQCKK